MQNILERKITTIFYAGPTSEVFTKSTAKHLKSAIAMGRLIQYSRAVLRNQNCFYDLFPEKT